MDQVSDAILDAYLAQDKDSRVAIETFASKDLLIVAGETRSNAQIDLESVARKAAAEIGYDSPEKGLDALNCKFMLNVQEQSADIAQGLIRERENIKSKGW